MLTEIKENDQSIDWGYNHRNQSCCQEAKVHWELSTLSTESRQKLSSRFMLSLMNAILISARENWIHSIWTWPLGMRTRVNWPESERAGEETSSCDGWQCDEKWSWNLILRFLMAQWLTLVNRKNALLRHQLLFLALVRSLNTRVDALSFWKSNTKDFPKLSRIAQVVFEMSGDLRKSLFYQWNCGESKSQ